MRIRLIAVLPWMVAILLGAAAGAVLAENGCVACHATAAESLATGPHAMDAGSCVACHGQPENHPASSDELMRFADEHPVDRRSACQGCHSDQHSAATANPHDRAGLACDDCHSVHEAAEPLAIPPGFEHADAASRTCFACHEDTFARFAFSERHRLAEGAVGCTSCHDPHEGDSASHLGGFTQDQCGECHADKTGPFVFEHSAQRVDGCIACHTPHGSPNRHMLTHQRVGELCYSCHAVVPQFHLGFNPAAPPRFDQDTVCTNCHVTIHGSNLDRNFLR